MTRRKFGNLSFSGGEGGKTRLEVRVKIFLQQLGFTSFKQSDAGRALVSQVPSKDLKIHFVNRNNMKFSFSHVRCQKDQSLLEYVLFETENTEKEQSMKFLIYISEKNRFRAFVPTKGNTFCKSSKTAFGTCGCHKRDIDFESHKGDMISEISKRFECSGTISQPCPVVTSRSIFHGFSTTQWEGEDEKYYDHFGRRDILSNIVKDVTRLCFSANSVTSTTKPKKSVSQLNHKRLAREFDKLPPEIIEIIMSYSDFFSTSLIFARVCLLWRNIIKLGRFQKDLFIRTWQKRYNTELLNSTKAELSNWCRLPLLFTFKMDGSFFSPWQTLVEDENSRNPNYKLLNEWYLRLYYQLFKMQQKHPKSLEWIANQWGAHSECEIMPIILNTNCNHKLVPDLTCQTLKETFGESQLGEYHGHNCEVENAHAFPPGLISSGGDCAYLESQAFEDLEKRYRHPSLNGQIFGGPILHALNCSALIKTLRKCFRFPDEFDIFEDFQMNEAVKDMKFEDGGYFGNEVISRFRTSHGHKLSEFFDKFLFHTENHKYGKEFDEESKKLHEKLRSEVFKDLKQETMVKFSNFASEEVALVFWMGEVPDTGYFVGYWTIVERDS